ncbi:hypothetical protein SE17_07345, partial [Kouleothrix aurantiaca]
MLEPAQVEHLTRKQQHRCQRAYERRDLRALLHPAHLAAQITVDLFELAGLRRVEVLSPGLPRNRLQARLVQLGALPNADRVGPDLRAYGLRCGFTGCHTGGGLAIGEQHHHCRQP